MFILPPNCIVPSATSLTISPVFPNFLYFISHTPSAAEENCDGKSRICPKSAEASKRFRVNTAPDCEDIHPTSGRMSVRFGYENLRFILDFFPPHDATST